MKKSHKKIEKKTQKNTKKGRKYKQISQNERDRIEILIKKGHKQKEIAMVLKRNPSTITREIKRNSRKKRIIGKGFIPIKYDSGYAQLNFRNRERSAKYQFSKISRNDELREYIIKKLKKDWNPDVISGRMREEKKIFYVSKSAIYDWFKTPTGERYEKYLYSARNRRIGRKRNKKKNTPKKEMIPNRVSISERPDISEEYGNWEGDTIVSGKKTNSKASLSVGVERKSIFLEMNKIPNLKPKIFIRSLEKIERKYVAKSFTLDNGVENKQHEKLRAPVFFCDPYSSWQKGKVEGMNKMIRRYIKKGDDISKYSNKYIKKVENLLNNMPRKSLGYKTPLEVMKENNLIKKQLQKNYEVV